MRQKRNKPLSQINVVPYIDVMLVLLVIFMITAPLLSQGVKVDLPNAAAQPISSKSKEPIVVSIDANGNYYLNIAKQPSAIISPDDLAKQVSQELSRDDQPGRLSDQPGRLHDQPGRRAIDQRPVLVKGDKNVDYGKVVKAMVLLQHAGAQSVGLMTQPDK